MSELANIRLADVDRDPCQIRIGEGKRVEDRVVPVPEEFEETLGMSHLPFIVAGGDQDHRRPDGRIQPTVA